MRSIDVLRKRYKKTRHACMRRQWREPERVGRHDGLHAEGHRKRPLWRISQGASQFRKCLIHLRLSCGRMKIAAAAVHRCIACVQLPWRLLDASAAGCRADSDGTSAAARMRLAIL